MNRNIYVNFTEFLNEAKKTKEEIEYYSNLVNSFMYELEDKYEDSELDIFIHYNKFAHAIILSKIVIPKSKRGGGIGTLIMNDLCEFANKYSLKIALTPTNDFGGTVSRLKSFYKLFGFVKNKQYNLRETMVRYPEI